MQVDLTISEVLDIIHTSVHPELITAILEGNSQEYRNKFPLVGTKVVINNVIGTVKSVNIRSNAITIQHVISRYYPNPEFTGNDYSSYQRGEYKYCKVSEDLTTTTKSLDNFNECKVITSDAIECIEGNVVIK